MITRILAGTIVGGIVMFVLGFLIYGLALEPYMKANMVEYAGLMKAEPDFILLIAANLVYALLLTFIADYWAGVRTFSGGLKLGAIVGGLIALFTNLLFGAFMNLYKGIVPNVVDVTASIVMGAITAGVIGLVLGKMNKTGETS